MAGFDFDCYQALRARDARFDGRFFVGVKTTGIYCRPVCPARTPLASSCVFVATAAAAERAGFRPCLRCRPELAPGGAGGPPLAQSLFTAIRHGVSRGESVRELTTPTGYSSRQLRRLTMQAFGVTPVEILQTERLLFAKKLLQETRLPMMEVAAAAGFRSLRRFNALFQARYRLAPTALRRSAGDYSQHMNNQPLYFTEYTSPIGMLVLRGSTNGLTGLYMEEHRHGPGEQERTGWTRDDARFAEACSQLGEYFAGARSVFDLPLDLASTGGSAFQQRVWAALRDIRYGETISYGELARRISQPAAVRAVGLANGRNPVSIIVPCHRVIGASGALTGFGGGIPRKRALLELEARGSGRALL